MSQNLITRILIVLLVSGVGTDIYLLWKRPPAAGAAKQSAPAKTGAAAPAP